MSDGAEDSFRGGGPARELVEAGGVEGVACGSGSEVRVFDDLINRNPG